MSKAVLKDSYDEFAFEIDPMQSEIVFFTKSLINAALETVFEKLLYFVLPGFLREMQMRM